MVRRFGCAVIVHVVLEAVIICLTAATATGGASDHVVPVHSVICGIALLGAGDLAVLATSFDALIRVLIEIGEVFEEFAVGR